jgi:hypothetical protein
LIVDILFPLSFPFSTPPNLPLPNLKHKPTKPTLTTAATTTAYPIPTTNQQPNKLSGGDETGSDNEVQRTMLQIVTELDGFDPRGNIKVSFVLCCAVLCCAVLCCVGPQQSGFCAVLCYVLGVVAGGGGVCLGWVDWLVRWLVVLVCGFCLFVPWHGCW